MGIEITYELTDTQVRDPQQLYEQERWSEDRTLADIERMLAETDVVVGLLDSMTGDLIAFARTLTDTVYKAMIFDVIVRSDRRGTGLGARLMDGLFAHPAVANVDHVELYGRQTCCNSTNGGSSLTTWRAFD